MTSQIIAELTQIRETLSSSSPSQQADVQSIADRDEDLQRRLGNVIKALEALPSSGVMPDNTELDDEIEKDLVSLAKKYGDEYLVDYLSTKLISGIMALQAMIGDVHTQDLQM